jgi:hypothetical protein
MPFTKIVSGEDAGKYKSESGRVYTRKQIRAYYATGGWKRPVRSVAVVVASIAIIAVASACGSSPEPSQAAQTPRSQVAERPVPVTQSPSARDVAASLGGTGFTELKVDKPSIWGMVEQGNFWINGTRYCVETFSSTEGRDARIKVAEVFGIVPKWETSTSIVYVSTKA